MNILEATEVIERLMYRCNIGRATGKVQEAPTEQELEAMWVTNVVCVRLIQHGSTCVRAASELVAEVVTPFWE